jgi:hypothetical protein
MRSKLKKWMLPLFSALGGAAAGFFVYRFAGCKTGACAITSNPVVSMLYMGLAGGLLFEAFGKGGGSKCSM